MRLFDFFIFQGKAAYICCFKKSSVFMLHRQVIETYQRVVISVQFLFKRSLLLTIGRSIEWRRQERVPLGPIVFIFLQLWDLHLWNCRSPHPTPRWEIPDLPLLAAAKCIQKQFTYSYPKNHCTM